MAVKRCVVTTFQENESRHIALFLINNNLDIKKFAFCVPSHNKKLISIMLKSEGKYAPTLGERKKSLLTAVAYGTYSC